MSDTAPAAATATPASTETPATPAPEAAASVTPSPEGTASGTPPDGTATPAPGKDEPPEPAKQPDFVRQAFARLTEKKGEFRRQQEQHKELVADGEKFRALVAKWKEDPGAVEELLGEDAFERLVEHYGKKGRQPTPDDRVSAIERQLAEERAQRQRDADAQAERDRQAAIDTGKAKVEAMARAAPEAYELVNAEGAYELVFSTMVAYARQHPEQVKDLAPGELFKISAEHVEKHLERQEAERLERLSKSKKFSGRFAAPQKPPVSDPPPGATAIPGSATLTSKVTGDAPPPAPAKQLTREESVASASAWLAAELKRQQAADATA